MGSYPHITDSNNSTYELFGPVNLFWSTRYNKAMTLFLACLQDFAEFAKDQENNIPLKKCFKLPCKFANNWLRKLNQQLEGEEQVVSLFTFVVLMKRTSLRSSWSEEWESST